MDQQQKRPTGFGARIPAIAIGSMFVNIDVDCVGGVVHEPENSEAEMSWLRG
jgi:hypothetical protein